MKKWEVWFADAPLEEGGSKVRPVLVLDPANSLVLTFKITSKPPRGNYPAEYRLLQWREAGLTKPSTVRCSKLLRIPDEDFMDRVGILQLRDIRGVQEIIRRELPEYSHLVEKFIPDDDPQINWIKYMED